MLLPKYNNRNHLIDLLRFLAASWVALFHFNLVSSLDNLSWYKDFCRFGYLGVPVFFVISGYCMGISEKHVSSANSFIVNRLLRIFPAYWFSVAVVFLIALFVKITTGVNSVTVIPRTAEGFLAIIFLYTSPLSNFKTINGVYLYIMKMLTTPFLAKLPQGLADFWVAAML